MFHKKKKKKEIIDDLCHHTKFNKHLKLIYLHCMGFYSAWEKERKQIKSPSNFYFMDRIWNNSILSFKIYLEYPKYLLKERRGMGQKKKRSREKRIERDKTEHGEERPIKKSQRQKKWPWEKEWSREEMKISQWREERGRENVQESLGCS